MRQEIASYFRWLEMEPPVTVELEVLQDQPCDLQVRDADSDVLFDSEKNPLSMEEYLYLKALALKSAADFQKLYESIPDPDTLLTIPRRTFYGNIPSTAREMYLHTKNVNAYYFGEIDVEADNEGSILQCRCRGFEQLEKMADFLSNPVIEGSYGELWTLRKVFRRFIWHDRIHARAMYRRAAAFFCENKIENPFFF
jgi:hypothetical protein